MQVTLNPQSFFYSQKRQLKNNTEQAFTSNVMRLSNGQAPHFTYFFRGDFQWKAFVKYLERHFANADKVNIYNGACSDGTEPFTLVMAIAQNLKSKIAEKFFPIKAFDLNADLVNTAKTGKIPLLPQPYTCTDLLKLKIKNRFREGNFLSYVNEQGKGKFVQFNQKTRDKIDFKQANVFTQISEMNGENSAVLLRNMWMYLEDYEQEILALRLGNKLKKGSVVVLGEYDLIASKAVEALTKNGFKGTYIDKVYEKMV